MLINKTKIYSSYLISPYNLENVVTNCNNVKIGKYNIYYSYDTVVKYYHFFDFNVVLIGYIFDIRNGMLDEKTILKNLVQASDKYAELEYLNGRFNIIIQDVNSTFLYSDASQLKPLVYNIQSESLSSHDELLKMILTSLRIETTRRPFLKHTELDFTRYEEIFKYNPSLELDLERFKFKRIYPRTVLEGKTASETFHELKPFLDESIKYISNKPNKIFVSITGGIDSRVSASLTNSFKDKVEYLTYTKPVSKLNTYTARRIYQIDENITQSMKNNLPWNHTIINLYDYDVNKEYNFYLDKFINSKHSYKLASYYKNVKKYNNAIHIKSTVFGMGKADFSKDLDIYSNTLDFYKKCVHGLSPEFFKIFNFDKEVEDYFQRNGIVDNVTMDRHYFDLFHLESRMGNWHSTLTLETDPETDEFIFTNSRKIIDLIQQPSINERRNFDLYKIIINHYWPILLYFGINRDKHKNLLELSPNYDNPIVYLSADIKVTGKNDTKMKINDEEVLFSPSAKKIKKNNFYGFTLKNENNNSQKVIIKSLYSNEKGIGKINVLIRQNNKNSIHDILDLNDGLTIELDNKDVDVDVFYDNDYLKPSWQVAGRILLKHLKN